MDNTIIDEFGSTIRPGILNFLNKISKNNELILWTNSKRIRTIEILEHFNLKNYFVKIITRENYDPEEINLRKNIEEYNYDVIIDDDKEEVEYNKSKGKIGILVEPYRKNKKMKEEELSNIIKKYKL
jgi:phosphoglycolate phosphatase-like HAD superfamily hydrolase